MIFIRIFLPEGHEKHQLIDECADKKMIRITQDFSFRVTLVVDPQFEFLFRAEVLKDPCLGDFPEGLAGWPLVNDQYAGPSSEPAEAE